MQTIQELLTNKKLTNNTAKLREFLLGKKVKVVGNRSGHVQQLGTIIMLDTSSCITVQYYSYGGQAMYWYDLTLVQTDTLVDVDKYIEDIEANITTEQIEINTLKIKKKFMIANKLETFDEDQFKVYQILQTLKTKSTDLDKAKVIADLVKS